jgi:hypothetical protein
MPWTIRGSGWTMHAKTDDDDFDYQLAPAEPPAAHRPAAASLPPVPHQPLRPGERVFAAQTVAPLPRPPERPAAARSTWLAAIREELVSASLGSVTAVFGVLLLVAAAALFLWGSSCLVTASLKPEEITGICKATKAVVIRDRKTGEYKLMPNVAPWSEIEFRYGERTYTTSTSHGAFGNFYFEEGDTAVVWVFYGMPHRAVIVPGSWQICQRRHAAYMRSWGMTWIGLSCVSFVGPAALCALAVLRLNAVRRGQRRPYALSLRFD